jgi:hypothetical protein
MATCERTFGYGPMMTVASAIIANMAAIQFRDIPD